LGGGTLKQIKLIGINSRFALIDKKSTGTKMAEKIKSFEKFGKNPDFSPVLNPDTS